jgi:hypothetical protein
MTRFAALFASAVISVSTIPALASECASTKDIDASSARWTAVRAQLAKAADNETNCRAYAASFYESVTLRHAAALCARSADQARNLVVLDSEIDAFNNLLATKCGSWTFLSVASGGKT